MPDLDTWPMPLYNVGPSKHLHAIGVMCACFNAFEESMFHLFAFHLGGTAGLPLELIEQTYFQYDDARRLKAIKSIFEKYEQETAVIESVENITEYFDWASEARNKLLHAEPYPSPFAKSSGRLHLIKRTSKRDPTPQYVSPDLPTLRDIADKIHWGNVTCAGIIVYLRYGRPAPAGQPLAPYALPGKLVLPAALELEPRPYNPPEPGRPHPASRE
jgi:hypothetical protein